MISSVGARTKCKKKSAEDELGRQRITEVGILCTDKPLYLTDRKALSQL